MKKELVVLAAIASIIMVSATVFAQVYPAGMVSYWKLDEGSGLTAFDSVGTNDGTLVNGPVWTNGKVDGALNFDGVDDYVDAGTNVSLNPRQHGWTAEMWIKSTQKTSRNGYYVRTMGRVCSGTTKGRDYWLLRTQAGHGTGADPQRDAAIFQISDGTNSAHAEGTTTVTDGVWHHLTFVYDYDNSKTYIYKDGVVDGFNDWSGILMGDVNPSFELQIGQANYSTEFFKGLIDEVRIYNRALSAEEIATVFAQVYPAGMVSYWKLDEGIRLEGGWPGNPDIVKLPDGTYRMYYSDVILSYYPLGSIVKSAVSPDGLTWTKESGTRLGYGYGGEDGHATSPEVIILDDGTYRMYYAYQYKYQEEYYSRILSAVSSDGLTWTKEAGIRVDNGGRYDGLILVHPDVIELPGGEYRMYYSGRGQTPYRILSAVSADALNWTKEEGVRIDIGGIYDNEGALSSVVVEVADGRYTMFYAGLSDRWEDQILSAISTDGLAWTKEEGIRIERGDYALVHPSDIIKLSDDQYRMYITADRYPTWGDRFRILSAIGTITIPIPATIDIDPNTLNLKSKDKWITAYIELPEGYDVNNIDVSTVMLNDQVQAEAHPTEIGDYDNDDIADLMVKFDGSAVQEVLGVGDEVELTVAGELTDGTLFEGGDTIRVIDKGKGK